MRPVRKNADDHQSDPWMSVLAAGRELGCAPQTVLKRALRGEFETLLVAGRTVVSRESVERAVEAARA